MILKKMCMMCMILSPNCCPVTIFEYSTTEVTLPSCLSVLSEHVASQCKWQSAVLVLIGRGLLDRDMVLFYPLLPRFFCHPIPTSFRFRPATPSKFASV